MKNRGYTSIRHILKYISLFGSVEILKILANLTRGKVTAILLGPLGTGLIAIYQNILEVIRSCTNIGLETASIQQLSEIDTDAQKAEVTLMAKVIRTWSLAMALFNLIACIAIFLCAGNFFFKDNLPHREILMLTPAAFLVPIAIGECAILKGTHKLKRVATVELVAAVTTVIATTIIYLTLGLQGIIPGITICFAIEAALHLYFCTKVYPYRIAPFSREIWSRGIPLLKFGIPYAVTAIMGAFTTTILYSIITSTEEVGLYKAGYSLIMYYLGVILSSSATDYFPRLTSVCHDAHQRNLTVNKQIHVSLTITTPIVMLFILTLPLTIHILYTPEFLPMAILCTMAGLFQLHRSISLPLEYVSLAHGHSWMFLCLECLYNLLTIVASYYLYHHWGLYGIGLALSLVGISNTIILGIINHCYYHTTISPRNWTSIICTSAMVFVIMLLCQSSNPALRYGVGIALTLATAIYSYLTLSKGIKNEE